MTTVRDTVAAIVAAHNSALPSLIQADHDARGAVELASAQLANAEAAVIVAQTAQSEVQRDAAAAVLLHTTDQTRGAVSALWNWSERVRSRLAVDGPSGPLSAFLARLEGRLLDALEGPVVIDHNAIEAEFQEAIKAKELTNVGSA